MTSGVESWLAGTCAVAELAGMAMVPLDNGGVAGTATVSPETGST